MTNVDLEDLEIQALDCARFVDRCIQLKDEKERIDVSAREDDIDGGDFFNAALALHENGKTAEILTKILDEKDHLFNGANDTSRWPFTCRARCERVRRPSAVRAPR